MLNFNFTIYIPNLGYFKNIISHIWQIEFRENSNCWEWVGNWVQETELINVKKCQGSEHPSVLLTPIVFINLPLDLLHQALQHCLGSQLLAHLSLTYAVILLTKVPIFKKKSFWRTHVLFCGGECNVHSPRSTSGATPANLFCNERGQHIAHRFPIIAPQMY